MAEKDDGPRLYGTPDPDNPPPAAKGGMRGERSADQDDGATLQRTLDVDGRAVVVEETSGAVFAEQRDDGLGQTSPKARRTDYDA